MTNKSIRELCNFTSNYAVINREERNLAAILYSALLNPDNLKRFKQLVECEFPIDEQAVGIYFEYAFLRDIWYNLNKIKPIEQRNNVKKQLIIDLLKPFNIDELRHKGVREFNAFFGCASNSDEHIQSPSNWSLLGNKTKGTKGINDNFPERDEFLKVCKFKWAFNVKPDIVIHTTIDHAICIEAKLESRESSYPSNAEEKKLFNKDKRVSQTYIQKYMMKELLGINTKFVMLVKKKTQKTADYTVLTWREVFQALKFGDYPKFINEWKDRVIND